MDETTSLLRDLVAIDSVNPSLVAGAAGEREIARFVAEWLTAKGLEVQVLEPVAGRPSVVGVVRGAGGGRSLMLNGHIDTVGTAGMARPHEPVERDGRLHGRGAYDMKCGVAAAMVAAARLVGRDLPGDVVIAAVADEEHASIGTSCVLETWRTDAAIVTEPSGLDLCIAHKGFAWADVELRGRAAHGSRPDLGVDAIAHMGTVLTGLRELGERLASGPADPLVGPGSLHASLIEGGQERSSYPERCRLAVERRLAPGEDAALFERELTELAERATRAQPALEAGVELGLVRDPFSIPAEHPLVELVGGHARGHGCGAALVGHPAWMDAALLAAAGIDTLVFGPAGAGAHAVEEWVELASVATCADVLTDVALDYCAR